MSVYEEVIDLVDHISGPANTASKSVLSLGDKMNLLQNQVKATQAAMLKAQALGNTKAYKKLGEDLANYKNALGSVEKQVTSEAAAESTSLKGVTSQVAELGGVYTAVAAAAAGAALAFGALIVAGSALAIEASTAKMQMISMFDALGGGVITGARVDDMLDEMRSKLGVTKDTMVPLVKEFLSMGVTSEDALQKMTTAALSAKALAGGSEAAAQSFTNLSKKIQAAAETGQALKIPLKGLGSLNEMGLNVNDVAQQMGISAEKLGAQLKSGSVDAKAFGNALQDALIAKGAGPLETMSLSASNLGAMLKEYLGDLFEDLGDSVKPFLAQVKDLFGIFDSKGKPSGQALKQGIEGVFKNVFSIATKVVPMVKHFLLDMIIFGLKAYIALKPIVGWFLDLRKNTTVMNVLTFALEGLGKVALVIGGALAVVVGIFVGMTALAGVVAGGLWTLIGVIGNVAVTILQFLGELPTKALQFGKDFVSGLVNGITSGAGFVVDAVKGLADGAKNTFKSVLGIHSPSTVMAQMGNYAGQGVAVGLNAAVPDVHGAASDLGGAAVGGASKGMSSGGAAGSSGGLSITVEAGAIVIQGGADKSVLDLTEEAISMLFERVALAQGL